MGASAIAPPIAAAANHGATYLIVVFMRFSCLLGRLPIWAMPNHDALRDEQFGVNLLEAQAMWPQLPWLACAHNPHNPICQLLRIVLTDAGVRCPGECSY
jgi:hypothetical protein